MRTSNPAKIILFDGVCNLCNSMVDFVLRHDQGDHFKFAALQSEVAQKLLRMSGYTGKPLSSVVLIEENKIFLKSTAILRVAKCLESPYCYAFVLIVIPQFVRDAVYTWIAAHRTRWFGTRSQCRMPDNKSSAKFLS